MAWLSGIHGMIIRSRIAVGLTTVLTRASAGAVEYMPIASVSHKPPFPPGNIKSKVKIANIVLC